MSLISISYDLSQPNRDYAKLIAAIKSYGNWCHVTESYWLIRTTATAEAVRNHLAAVIDSDDKLIVGVMTGELAWQKLSKSVADWLHNKPVAV